jgi:hypothetical protein
MAQVKRGAGESLIPLFSHPTPHFGKLALTMRQQQYLLLVVFQGGAMEFGNLMSYAPDLDDLFGRSTKCVDKVVRGTNPSRLSGGVPGKISAHFQSLDCEGARPDNPESPVARTGLDTDVIRANAVHDGVGRSQFSVDRLIRSRCGQIDANEQEADAARSITQFAFDPGGPPATPAFAPLSGT